MHAYYVQSVDVSVCCMHKVIVIIVRINAPNGPHATCELVWLQGAAPSPASSPHPVSFVCLLLFCVPSASELGAAEWGGEGRGGSRAGVGQCRQQNVWHMTGSEHSICNSKYSIRDSLLCMCRFDRARSGLLLSD